MEELWHSIAHRRMVFQRVIKNFATYTSFNKSFIPIEPMKDGTTVHSVKCLSFGKFFDFNPEEVPTIVDILKNKTTSWTKPTGKKVYEKDIVIKVAQQLLVPLVGEVVLEPGYNDAVWGINGLTTDAIGIGSNKTFHGTPDGRVNGVQILFLPADDDDDEEEEEEEEGTSSGLGSSGISTPAAIAVEHIHKLVATSVTSSFTLHNVSKRQNLDCNSLSPTLLINHEKFYVCLYDCVKDLLLLSDSFSLLELRGSRKILAPKAMLAIWVIVNHRKFLKRLEPRDENFQSGIVTKLLQDGVLTEYKNLENTNLNFPGGASIADDSPWTFVDDDIPTTPPAKRART